MAARQAADGLALGFAEEGKPLEKLIADLESQDARVRDHAVRVLADRKSAAAVPGAHRAAARRRPRGRAPRRRARSRRSATSGRSRRSSSSSQSDDPALTARVARLIGDIGGAEAEGYLLTLEAGHPDPRVRAAAREALGELQARAQQAGALSVRK